MPASSGRRSASPRSARSATAPRRMLREAGYIAAVEVPEQRIADGNVRFTVLMAKLVGIRVRGDAGRSERMIARYLEQADRAARCSTATRPSATCCSPAICPAIDVRLALRSAGAARGEVIGEVTVARRPVSVDLNVQNLGSRELGRWGALLRGQLYGLTGLGDRTTIAPLHHRRHGRAADPPGRPRLPDRRRGPRHRRAAHLFLGEPGPRPARRRHRVADPVRHRGGELSVHPAADAHACAARSASTSSIRTSTSTPSRSTATGCASPSPRLDFDALGLSPGNPLYTPAEPLLAAGRHRPRRGRASTCSAPATGCGPGLALCLAPGAVPPTRLEGDPTATVLRGTASLANTGRCRGSPSPSDLRGQYSARSPAQLRGIFGRQLYGRARLRSRRPARRQRHRLPGRAALRQRHSAPPRPASPPSPMSSSTMPGSGTRTCSFAPGRQQLSSVGARRARRLWRPLPDRRPRRRAARPAALPDRARRHPLPRLAHHPAVAMEIQMTMSAPLPARRARCAGPC